MTTDSLVADPKVEAQFGWAPILIGDALCPYRFSFRVTSEGLVTLVVYEAPRGVDGLTIVGAVGQRLLPPVGGQSIGFSPDQCKTILEVFAEAARRRAIIARYDKQHTKPPVDEP